MALGHSPGIVTNGLIFAYDMNNTGKSFLGAPATNLYGANLGDVNSVTSWGKPTAGTATITDSVVTNLGSFNGNRIWRVTVSAGTVMSYSSWRDCLPAGFDATYGTTRRLSCKIFMEKGSITAIGAHNGGGNGSYSAGDWSDVDPNTVTGCEIKSGWKQYDVNVSGSYPSGHCVGLALLSSDIQFLVTEMAVTNTSFRVPFTSNSRSNTQALVDQTGNNIITASSVTYASDNTFSFNGSSNTMDCGNASAISAITGTSNVTVEAWARYSSYSGGAQSYSVITHKGYPWAWLMENPSNTARIRFYLSSSGDVSCSDSATHALNTWYHFVGTYDGFNMRFYRNGELRNTVAGSGTLGGSGINMVVGSYSGGYYMNGSIPILRIYNRTLNASEILQNFNAIRSRYGI